MSSPRKQIWLSVLAVSGTLMIVPGAAAVIAAVIDSGFFGPSREAMRLAVFGTGMAAVGLILWKVVPRPVSNSVAVNSAAVALSWIGSTLLCAIPFLLAAHTSSPDNDTLRAFRSPLNAWYESASSLSSSGLSTANRSSELPHHLQIWRSVCQWVGGVGLAVFGVLLLDPAEEGHSVYQSEARDWQPHQTTGKTVVSLMLIYGVLTLLCGASYWLAGMPGWQAVNHSLITVSTGGLTVTDDSFTSYSGLIKTLAALFSWLGAVSFGGLYLLFTGRLKKLGQQTALRSLVFWTLLLLLAFGGAAWNNKSETAIDSVFNMVSAVSTCGISSGNLAELSVTCVWLLIIAMFVGGCSDSTAGGIKIDRATWMARALAGQLRRNLGDDEQTTVQWNGRTLPHDETAQRSSRTLVILFVFLATLASGFLCLRLAYEETVPSDRVFFQATSALGAVGLSMDLTGADRPAAARVVEIILMIAGRLEIIALFFVPAVLAGRVAVEHSD